jgi:hypothetical protein
VLAVVGALAMVGFWAWILSGAPKRDNPDRVDDRQYVAAVDRHCRAAVRAIDALPPAIDSKTPSARADVVDEATAVLGRLVDRIEADAPRAGDDAIRLKGWVRDWRIYLGNRRDYATRLQSDRRAQFLVDVNKAGDPIDRPIKNFADINDIPACDPPGDVG